MRAQALAMELDAEKQRRLDAENGDMIWLEASYNPILNRHGKPKKVVKFAQDL